MFIILWEDIYFLALGLYLYFDIRKHKPFGVYGYILVTFVRKVENLNKIGVKCMAEWNITSVFHNYYLFFAMEFCN